MSKLKLLVALIVIFLTPETTNAFTFEFLGMKEPVHTDMALKALRCAIDHPAEDDFNCDNYDESQSSKSTLKSTVNPLELTEDNLYDGVIWADDPIRELKKYKFHRVILWTFRLLVDECADLKKGLPDGIRCSVHYGNMQFMHSMEGESNVTASDTQNALLDWAEFAYKVALNDKDVDGKYFKETPHCSYFNSENPSKLEKSMLPNGSGQFPCNDLQRAWTVGTIFSFNCLWRSETCWEYTHPNNETTRIAGLGAILHTIQDSYAKGHTSRGNDQIVHINQIECAPITQFQNYTQQNHDVHSKADEAPKKYSDNCFTSDGLSTAIHGPVTASAQVLRMFARHASPLELRSYLKTHVFALADETEPSGSTTMMKKEG